MSDHPGPPRTNRTLAQVAGDGAEARVADRLTAAGWKILARNVRAGRGEIDIVAVDPGPHPSLVIVEVRWRRTRGFGLGEETVDHRKRAHLRVSIARLLEDGLPGGAVVPSLPIRVDLVVVEPATSSGGALRFRHHRAIPL